MIPQRARGDDVGERVGDERRGQPDRAEEERAETRDEHHRSGLRHRAERKRRTRLAGGDDLRQQHLVRRPGDDAQQAREDDPDVDVPDRDVVRRDEQSNDAGRDGADQLHEQEQAPAVVRVGDHAADRQQQERCGGECRASGDREGGVREQRDQPRLRQKLQRVAGIGDAPPEPEETKRRPPERRRGHTASHEHLTLYDNK